MAKITVAATDTGSFIKEKIFILKKKNFCEASKLQTNETEQLQ